MMARKSSTKTSLKRSQPMTPKAGVTRNGKRRYGCGGTLKK